MRARVAARDEQGIGEPHAERGDDGHDVDREHDVVEEDGGRHEGGEAYGYQLPSGWWRTAPTRTVIGAMPRIRRFTTSAHRRLALLALGAALGLGLAGRIAVHAGGYLPHGDALSALGAPPSRLAAPGWRWPGPSARWPARGRAERSAGSDARAGHCRLVPADGRCRRSRGRGLRRARRRRMGRRRARRGRALRAGGRRLARRQPPGARGGHRRARGRPGGRGAVARRPVVRARGGAGADDRAQRRASVSWSPPAAGHRSGSRCWSSPSPRWPSRVSRTACATRCAWPAGRAPSALRARAPRARGPRCAR